MFYHYHHLPEQGYYTSSMYTKFASCDCTINTITVFVTVDLQMHSMLII
jgi:hypothetical protein